MAKSDAKRIDSKVLKNDEAALDALKAIPTYTPMKPELSTATVGTLAETLQTLHTAETQAEAAFNAARDNAVAAEWAFHEAILGVKDQVASQFGRNSNEYQALGLKKKMERKPPVRKPKTA
jgi:hypothetical protein